MVALLSTESIDENEGGEAEFASLAQAGLQPCVACDACHKTGLCPLPDGYEVLAEERVGWAIRPRN